MPSESEQIQQLQARIGQLEETIAQLRANESELQILPEINIEEIRLTVNYLSDFISIISPSAAILYLNRSMDGRPLEEVIGTSLFDYSPPETHHIIEAALRQAIEQKVSVSYESETVFDGESYWFLSRLIPIIKDGQVTKLIAISTDNTEQHKILQDLHLSKTRLSELFNNTPLAAIVWDEQQKTIEWNPAAERIFGWRKDEAIGKGFVDLIIPAEEREFRQELFNSAMASGRSHKYLQSRNITKSGKIITCEWWGTALKDANGKSIGIASFAEDITEKQAAEQALKNAKKQAEDNARAKSTFLANMSHEIRTPMNGITGLVDLLMQSQLPADEKENLNLIKQSTNNLLSIVNDILDFSKIESGSVEIETVATDIQGLLSEIYHLMKPVAESKHLEFVFTPELTHNTFLTDPVRVKQIIGNLVTNALKFTSQGKVEINAKCTSINQELTNLQVEVIDTGIGIPAEKLVSIFEDFYQGDESITRRFGGTGLGLTISNGLAKLLGGDISVTSTLDRGSTFTLNLPLKPAAADSDTKLASTSSSPIPNYNKCILLVDDNPVNLLVGKKLLQALGINVLTAENGAQAIEILRATNEVDLVLLDMQMPVMDGVTATPHIRALSEKYQNIPIIAVTANVLPEERLRCKQAGMNGFLAKPFSFLQLVECLDPWFSETHT